MTTNLLIFAPEVPDKAIKTATSDTWGDSIRLNELHNNRCGPRGNLARLQTAKTGRTVISYDMGVNGSQSVDHLAVSRADLLQSDSVASLIVRGSAASAFAPSDISGCVAWWDPNTGVTVDSDGGVSAWVDRVGSLSASQATAASRPILSRYDNKENAITYSEALTNAAWNKATYPATATDAATTNYLGASTASKILSGSGTGRHGISWINSTNRTLRIAAGSAYYIGVDVKKSNFDYAWIGVSADSVWHGCMFDIVNGVFIGTGANVTTKTATSLGSGWWRVEFTFTATSDHLPDLGIWFGDNANYGSPPSGISRAGTEEIYIARPQLKRTTADSAYLAVTGVPQFAGINGSRTMYYGGAADALRMDTLAATFSGTDKANSVFLVTQSFSTYSGSAAAVFAIGSTASSTQYFRMRFDTGNIRWNVQDDAALAKNNSSGGLVTTSVQILSHIDTGTAANDYLNGTLFGSANYDLDVGAKTLNVAAIGARFNVASYNNYYGGSIAEVIVYSRALTSTERQSVEAYLTAKYSTPPLVADYALAPNSAEDARDYISTFTASSSYRYFWVEMDSSASGKFTHSKLFIGAAVDMGETVDFISCQRPDDANDDYESDSGAIDLAAGKGAPYRVTVTWKGITDAQLENFLSKVASNAELRPGVFLCTTANHQLLDGLKSLYVRLSRAPVYERLKADYNTLTAEFEELVL